MTWFKPIGIIGNEGENVQEGGTVQQTKAVEPVSVQVEKQRNKFRISPAARKMARELDVDTNKVTQLRYGIFYTNFKQT